MRKKKEYTLTLKRFIGKFRKYYSTICIYRDGNWVATLDGDILKSVVKAKCKPIKPEYANALVESVIEDDNCITDIKGTVRVHLS